MSEVVVFGVKKEELERERGEREEIEREKVQVLSEVVVPRVGRCLVCVSHLTFAALLSLVPSTVVTTSPRERRTATQHHVQHHLQ